MRLAMASRASRVACGMAGAVRLARLRTATARLSCTTGITPTAVIPDSTSRLPPPGRSCRRSGYTGTPRRISSARGASGSYAPTASTKASGRPR